MTTTAALSSGEWVQLAGIVATFGGVVVTAVASLIVATRKSARERPEAAEKAVQLQGQVSEVDAAQNLAIATILAQLSAAPSKAEAEAAIAEIRLVTEELLPPKESEGSG